MISMPLMSVCKLYMRQDTNSSFNQPSSNIHHVLSGPQCWTHIVLLLLVICCLLVWHQNKWVKMWKTRAAVLGQGAAACQIRCQNQILTLSVRWGGRCWQIHQIFVKKGKQSQAKKTKKKHIHCFAAVWPRFVFWSSFSWERVDKSLSVQNS